MLPKQIQSLAEMLAEIQSETGTQLMNSVLYQTSPPGSTGLPGLDVHLLSSTATRASSSSSLNRGDVLEIQGPAASGKTRLVYYLTVQCLLPRKVILSEGSIPVEVEIGGWEKAAVILDTDGRWNVRTLRQLLTSRLEKLIPDLHEHMHPSVPELVTESLRRLHIFRPKSSGSLAATLFRLPTYHAVHMPAEEIALLVIDSISSFYWIDRYNLEQRSDRKDATSPLNRILIALQEIRLNHGPVTVLTNWALSVPKAPPSVDNENATASPFYRQHLYPFPAPFENPPRLLPNVHLMPPITHHITLSLSAVEQIPGEVSSVQDALEMASQKPVGSRRNEIKGILRTIETGSMTTFTVGDYEESSVFRMGINTKQGTH